jgi:arsenate reductase-like glutaredoxin family protein
MNLDYLKNLHESCQKSMEELNSQSENLILELNKIKDSEKDPSKIQEIEKANALIQRMFSQAKNGNLEAVKEITQEIKNTYGSNNKK